MRSLFSVIALGSLACTFAAHAELLNSQVVDMPVTAQSAASVGPLAMPCRLPLNDASTDEYLRYGRCERDRLIKNTATDIATRLPALGHVRNGPFCQHQAEAFTFDTNSDGSLKYSTHQGMDSLLTYQCITKKRVVDGQNTYALATFFIRVLPSCNGDEWMRDHFSSQINRQQLSLSIFMARLAQTCSFQNGIQAVPVAPTRYPTYAQNTVDYPSVQALMDQLREHNLMALLKIVAKENNMEMPMPQLLAPAAPSAAPQDLTAPAAGSAAQVEGKATRSPASEKHKAHKKH